MLKLYKRGVHVLSLNKTEIWYSDVSSYAKIYLMHMEALYENLLLGRVVVNVCNNPLLQYKIATLYPSRNSRTIL